MEFYECVTSLGQLLREQITECEIVRNPLNSLPEFPMLMLLNSLPQKIRHQILNQLRETSWAQTRLFHKSVYDFQQKDLLFFLYLEGGVDIVFFCSFQILEHTLRRVHANLEFIKHTKIKK